MERTRWTTMTVFTLLATMATLSGCTPARPTGPCEFAANTAISAYRLPDDSSDFFGTVGSGETHEALARTAEGWLGFDPGIAQAGNIGLAHHRWVRLSAIVSPSCVASIDLVTLEDVESDVAASGT
jgi:hypothetical protein